MDIPSSDSNDSSSYRTNSSSGQASSVCTSISCKSSGRGGHGRTFDEKDNDSVVSLSFSDISLPQYHDLPQNLSDFPRRSLSVSRQSSGGSLPQPATKTGSNRTSSKASARFKNLMVSASTAKSNGVSRSSFSTSTGIVESTSSPGSNKLWFSTPVSAHFTAARRRSKHLKSWNRVSAVKRAEPQQMQSKLPTIVPATDTDKNGRSLETVTQSDHFEENSDAVNETHQDRYRCDSAERNNTVTKWKSFSEFQKKLDTKDLRLLDVSDSSSSSGWDSDDMEAAAVDGNPHRVVRLGSGEEVTALQNFERWLNTDTLHQLLDSSESEAEIPTTQQQEQKYHHLQHHRIQRILSTTSPETKTSLPTNVKAALLTPIAVIKNAAFTAGYSLKVAETKVFSITNEMKSEFAGFAACNRFENNIKRVDNGSDEEDSPCSPFRQSSNGKTSTFNTHEGFVKSDVFFETPSRRLLELHFNDTLSPIKPIDDEGGNEQSGLMTVG